MTITIPFSVGDTVWHASLIQSHYEFPCPTCKGTGTLMNCNEDFVNCGTCYGHKTKGATKREYVTVQKTIDSIYVFAGENETWIDSIYFKEVDDEGCTDFTQCIEDVHKTREECEAYCRNKNTSGEDGTGLY